MPQRIQLRRTKGWRLPDGAVSVARPSIAGNPFVIGKHGDRRDCIYKHRQIMTSDDHAMIIRLFEELYPGPPIEGHLSVGRERVPYTTSLAAQKADWFICGTRPAIINLCRGRDLACYCRLTDDCHGNTLIKVCN